MKQFKHLFIAAAALLIGLSSCISDNDSPNNGDNNETGKVQFHLILPETRLEGPTQAENPVAIVRGTLLFTNTAGVIQHVFTIGNGATYDVQLASIASPGGHLFTNIHATARVVHFVGNTTVTPDVGNNISTVLDGTLSVLTQAGNITAGTEQVVNVYGYDTMIAPGTPGDPWTAVVNVEPTVGRIELHHITGDHTIAGFTVDGIFMDRYFEEAHIDGRLIGNLLLRGQGTLTNAQYAALFNWPTSVHPANPALAFTLPMLGPVFDWNASGWASAPVESSTFDGYVQGTSPVNATYVWGYNLFADYSNAARTLGSQFPHTVIRLSNVTVNARIYRWEYEAGYGPADDPDTNNAVYTFPYVGVERVFDRIEVQPHPLHNHNAGVNQVPHLFLTIRGFIHNGVVIDRDNGFLPRRVYQIGVDAGDGWFGVDDIFLVPNVQPIDVNVEVVRMRWINLDGRPVFN